MTAAGALTRVRPPNSDYRITQSTPLQACACRYLAKSSFKPFSVQKWLKYSHILRQKRIIKMSAIPEFPSTTDTQSVTSSYQSHGRTRAFKFHGLRQKWMAAVGSQTQKMDSIGPPALLISLAALAITFSAIIFASLGNRETKKKGRNENSLEVIAEETAIVESPSSSFAGPDNQNIELVMAMASIDDVEGGDELLNQNSTVAEEVLAAMVEEKLQEMEILHREELEAVTAMAEAESSVLREKANQRESLEKEVTSLRQQLDVVKELTEYLLDAKKSGEFQLAEAVKNSERLEHVECKLLDRDAELSAMAEVVEAMEKERNNLTIELRDSLAAYAELSSRCDSLASDLESARVDRSALSSKLALTQSELADMRRQLARETIRLADAEQLVAEKMGALGEKEIELERVLRQVDTLRLENEDAKAQLAIRESALHRAESDLEERQLAVAQELTWLRNTVGESTVLVDKLESANRKLRMLLEKSINAGEILDGDGAEFQGGNFPNFSGGSMFKDSWHEVIGDPGGNVDGELLRAKVASLRWELANSIISCVRLEKRHWEEMEALKQQIISMEGLPADSRLESAQNEIQLLRGQLLDKEEEFEKFQQQAQAAMGIKDEYISKLRNQSSTELLNLEASFLNRKDFDLYEHPLEEPNGVMKIHSSS